MLIVCPDCGADQQEVGKYCENCGRLLTAADAQGRPPAAPTPAAWPPPATQPTTGPAPWNVPSSPPVAPTPAGGARFAVVRNRQANPAEGFTITYAGEFLVGRPNMDTGTGVDVDLRQWVQPLEVGGQKQYLVHRSQCFLGIAPDGAVTIRPCPGAENDTLVKPVGAAVFVPLAQLGSIRPLRPDSAYPLQPGDRLFMGDPTAIPYFEAGDPTAQGTYLVLELLP
ncbi:MAG: hypothetical protein ACR2M0_08655 [Chloroflexia bacterium]